MRKNFGARPLSYPQPVFIIATYGEDGTPDAMNAAWGGISEENEISLCLSAGHKTVKNILKRGAFTISMADAAKADPVIFDPFNNEYLRIGGKAGKAFCDGKQLK